MDQNVRIVQARVRRPTGLARQAGVFLVADALYEVVRGVVAGRRDTALANADWLIHVERSMGIFHERQVQHALLGHPAVVAVADWLYLNVQFTANLAFLVFLLVLRPSSYVRARNTMFAAMGIALVVHLLFPVAPPRMLTADGFVDTVKQHGVDQDSGALHFLVNPFAAMPSMHVCFAVIVGLTGAAAARRRTSKAAWAAYPVLVAAIVVVTANHFFVDIAGGVATAAAARGVAALI
jgi:hypothetical protein